MVQKLGQSILIQVVSLKILFICIHSCQSNLAAYVKAITDVKKSAKAFADIKPVNLLKIKNTPNQAYNFVIFQWSSLLKITFSVAQPCQIYRLLVYFFLTFLSSFKGYSCADLYRKGLRRSGTYYLQIQGTRFWYLKVFCDMETDGGGWMVRWHH